MKKKIIISVIALCFSCNVNSQSWQWAKHCGSTYFDFAGGFCQDTSNNLYVIGQIWNLVNSGGTGFFGNDSITTIGYEDLFITKLDKNGNFIWAERAGGYDLTNGHDGATMAYEISSNSLIVAGRMDNVNQTIGGCSLNAGNLFLSKLDLNGNCVWAVNISNYITGTEYGNISVDDNQNIYLIGTLNNGGSIGGISLQPGIFLAKFNSTNGSCHWAKTISDLNTPLGEMKYFNGNLYLGGGSVNDTFNLDTATIYCYPMDIFISKFDTSGNVQWVKTMGGPNVDRGGSIGLDGSGNIYTSGTFRDTSYFDADTLTNGSNDDFYLAKYDSNANLVWVKQAHTNAALSGYISVSNNGNVYAAGVFSDTATFGSFTINAFSPADMFIASYSNNGECLGVTHVGDAGSSKIITDSSGSIYLCGGFSLTPSFGSYTLTTYGNNTASDVYIAKHDAITGIGENGRLANNQLIIYANPTNGKCNITIPDEFLNEKKLVLSVYDNTGKIIQQKNLEMNEGKIKLNLEEEARGIYNVTLSNNKKSYQGKIVFE